MYESLYHFALDPFRLSPDQRFCFQHRSYTRARAYLQYALNRAEGFVMITGRPGSGKTTLLDDLLANMNSEGTVIARLVTTQLGASDLLRMVAYAFQLNVEGLEKSSVIRHLEDFLMRQHRAHHRALLIIDEAQDLEHGALEEMRLLTNLQMNNLPLLQVFLVGQENLQSMIQNPAMEQLHQRLIASSRLEPLSAQETAGYVLHRLNIAGWQQDPQLSMGALRRIHLFSGGIPRRINQLCSRLLLYGAMEEKHIITSKDVQEVIGELRQEQLAPATDEDPPAGSLEADDKIMASDTPDKTPSVAPLVQLAVRRRMARARSQAESKSNLAYLRRRSSGREAQSQSENNRLARIAVIGNTTYADVKPGPVPPLALVRGVGLKTQVSEIEEAVNEAVKAFWRQVRTKLLSLVDHDGWLLRNDGLVMRIFAFTSLIAVLIGVISLVLMQKPEVSRITALEAIPPAVVVSRDEPTALRHRLSERLSGEVMIENGRSPMQLLLQINIDNQFRVNDDAMSPELVVTLISLADLLHDFPRAAVLVVGHCDQNGAGWRNKILSEQRALAVAGFLAQQGIAVERLRTEGRGNSEPRSQTEQRLNRRVELAIDFSRSPVAGSGNPISQPANAGDFHSDVVAGL